MKTLDLNKPITAHQLNENMFKKFGVKVNFDKYTREELENYRNLLRTKIFQVEQSTGFNVSLTDDTYQKDKYMVTLLNTKIKEMLGESKKALKVKEGEGDLEQQEEAYVACIVQHNRSGRAIVHRTKPINHERAEEVIRHALSKNTFVHPPFMTIYPASAGKLDGSTIMAKFPDMSKEGSPVNSSMMEGKKAKPDFLDMDKDGNKKEPMKKAVKDKKMKESLKGNQGKLDVDKDGKLEKSDFAKLRAKKKVKEGIEHVAELAHHHASEYAKHHRMGNLEQCGHHKKACEECGGMITHGPMGECYHKHAGIMGGMPYGIKEGGMAPAAPMGGAPAPAVGGMQSQGMGTPEQGAAHNPVLGGTTVGETMETGKFNKTNTTWTDKSGKKHPAQRVTRKTDQLAQGSEDQPKDTKKKSKVKENQHKVQIARLQYLREDEEEKAKTITAGSDMVNDFTTWMTRVGQYQTKSMIELADQIRQEFGQMESEAFKQAVAPALEQALQALSQTRETISSAVATLAGGGTPTPMGGGMEEPGMDGGAMPPPEMAGDEFAAADAAAGGSELAGRETREARQLFARKLSEAHSLVRSLSRSK